MRRVQGKASVRLHSRRCGDRFLHHPPACLRQRPYAAPGQIPQTFISVAAIKNNDASARVRVVKSPAGIFLDQSKESFPPGSIRRIEDLLPKLLKFFNADYSDRFGDRFAAVLIDGFDVLKFFKWHTTPLFRLDVH